jgi:5-methylcytosine-specific restriction endonuclease McrA
MRKKKKSEPILSSTDKRFRTVLISVLRRFSRFWEPSNSVLKKARIARGMYQCSLCSKVVGSKEMKVDHIEPVVPVTGFTTWDDLISRLFCEESGLQAICKPCHDEKTKKENEQRRRCMKEKAVLKYYKDKMDKDE